MAAPLRVGLGETLPQGPGEHETLQLTPLLPGSFSTVATMFGTLPAASRLSMLDGVTETVTKGTVMVTVADLVESVFEVAVTVTVRSLVGGVVGAV